jgi:hypothetical protein
MARRRTQYDHDRCGPPIPPAAPSTGRVRARPQVEVLAQDPETASLGAERRGVTARLHAPSDGSGPAHLWVVNPARVERTVRLRLADPWSRATRGAPGAADELLRAVGFRDVRSQPVAIPVRPPTVDAAQAFMREGVPVLSQVMGLLDGPHKSSAGARPTASPRRRMGRLGSSRPGSVSPLPGGGTRLRRPRGADQYVLLCAGGYHVSDSRGATSYNEFPAFFRPPRRTVLSVEAEAGRDADPARADATASRRAPVG